MEQGFSFADIVAILRRRWPLLAIPLAIGAPLAVMIALVMPPTYVSTGRLLVESQTIPEELARSTVTTGATEQVSLIQQRLKTRANMLDLARRFDIYADRPDLSPTDIYYRMSEATRIDNIVLATRNRGQVTASAVHISFSASNPQTAAAVTNELVNQLLERNRRDRSERASGTLDFFRAENARIARELDEVNDQLTKMKAQERDALPESLEFRRSELSRLEQQIFERQNRILALEGQLSAIESAAEEGVAIGGVAQSPEQAELQRLEQELLSVRAIYAETHPTIRRLTANIAALRDRIGRQESGEAGDQKPQSGAALQLAQLRTRLDREKAQLADERKTIEALKTSINRTPNVETALSQLERQRDALQSQYQTGLAKQAEAEIGERLEVSRQAERFELIEQPEAPARPTSPNRPLIILGGVGFCGALGVGLMLLAEFLNKSIQSARDLTRKLDLQPIVTIPYIRTRSEKTRAAWLRRLVIFGLIVALPAALYLVDEFYKPLPVLAERLLDKSGLRSLVIAFENRFRM